MWYEQVIDKRRLSLIEKQGHAVPDLRVDGRARKGRFCRW